MAQKCTYFPLAAGDGCQAICKVLYFAARNIWKMKSGFLMNGSFRFYILNVCWQGYVPTALERRGPVMERKRQEYCKLVEHYYHTRLQELHQETFRQVADVSLAKYGVFMKCIVSMYIVICEMQWTSVNAEIFSFSYFPFLYITFFGKITVC